jgi:hypothetical protein
VLFEYFQHSVRHIPPISSFAGYFRHDIEILEPLERFHCGLIGDLELLDEVGGRSAV